MSVGICTHFRKLTDLSLPMIVNAIILEAQYTSTMIFVGRLGEAKYLGAATVGNMLCNITGYSLGYGLCSALDTLVSQAFGAKEYGLVGLHGQRAAVILTIFAIPVAFVWWETDWFVYNVMGIDKEISYFAGQWARWILLGLWPTLMFQVLRKLLQGCGIMWPVIVASFAAAVANVIGSYVMIDYLGWGFTGAALSVGVAQWAGFLTLAAVICIQVSCLRKPAGAGSDVELSVLHKNIEFTSLPQEEDLDTSTDTTTDTTISEVSSEANFSDSALDKASRVPALTARQSALVAMLALRQSFAPAFPLEEVFPALSTKVWAHWGVFLELGMPGALSLFLEWGSYELMAMVAGQLGTIELATHGVFMSTCSIIYNVPMAISDATGVIAGNYLGHGDPQEAKSVIKLGICYDMVVGLAGASMLLFVLRPVWGSIFTSDVEVQKEVYAKMPIMFVYITVDSMKCIALNVLRSTGRPHITMVGNIFCCAAIMLPLGWYWAITLDYGLLGVWGAMSVGWATATLVYLTVLFRTDWEEQARLAAKRNSVDQIAPVLENDSAVAVHEHTV